MSNVGEVCITFLLKMPFEAFHISFQLSVPRSVDRHNINVFSITELGSRWSMYGMRL